MATMNNLTLMNLEGMAAEILKARALHIEEQKKRQMEMQIGQRRQANRKRLARIMFDMQDNDGAVEK